MARWFFSGRVLPERVGFSMSEVLGSFVVSELGYCVDFRIVVCAGQIIADVSVTQGSIDVLTIRNDLESVVHSHTDLAGFRSGLALDVEFVSAMNIDDGEWRVFGVDIPTLREGRGAPNRLAIEKHESEFLTTNNFIANALADFREAMRSPQDTGFFCYRAIECLRQSMKSADADNSDKATWERLVHYLGMEDSEFSSKKGTIKRFADKPRHGDRISISDAERAQVLKFTEAILETYVSRALELRKGTRA